MAVVLSACAGSTPPTTNLGTAGPSISPTSAAPSPIGSLVRLTPRTTNEQISTSPPTPTGAATPSLGLGLLTCAGEVPSTRVTDFTGELLECRTYRFHLDESGRGAGVSNPGGDVHGVEVVWPGSSCITSVDVDVRATYVRPRGDRFQIRLVSSTDGGPCSPVYNVLTLRFVDQVPAETVTREVINDAVPPVPPDGFRIDCPYGTAYERDTEITVVDHTGFLGGCFAAVGGEAEPGDQPVVDIFEDTVFGDGVFVDWTVPATCTHMPARVDFSGNAARSDEVFRVVVTLLDPHAGEAQGCRPGFTTQSIGLYGLTGVEPSDVEVTVRYENGSL